MPKDRVTRRLSSGFNLGGQQAEADPFLGNAFFETAAYRAVSSKSDPNAFVVGRTGSGKSALLNRIEADYRDHVIRISPQDLSLPYVADSTVVRTLKSEGIHLDPLFIALWKHVLVVEVLRHRYNIDSLEAKQNFMASLLDKIKRDKSKSEALKYLDEFQGKFWSQADVRVREITDSFETNVNNLGKLQTRDDLPVVVNLERGGSTTQGTVVREEWVSRAQRIVNETQLARLNQMIKVLDEDILDSSQNFTYIVIDDLDLDWVEDAVLNDLIRCLFRAVLDLKRVRNLKIVVALRTNIFQSLDFGSRTGGQEEKFRALTLSVRWSEADLERMLDERVRVAAQEYSVEIGSLAELLPATNKTRGSALDFVLRRTLMRPRDAIAFFNLALEQSTNRPRLTWDKIHSVERPYSTNRLLALRDEWKPTFPDIDVVLREFAGADVVMSKTSLSARLDSVALLLASNDFGGAAWLTPLCDRLWDYETHSWSEKYGGLSRVLFDIGFLGCSIHKSQAFVYKHVEPGLLDQDRPLEGEIRFTVHPAFRMALDILPD